MTAAAAPVLAFGAGRRYGSFWALRDCDLHLPLGSITAVVGPNGAGKTTLLNMLAGLLPTSEGRLTVFGQQPSSRPGFLSQIGFLAQDCPVYRHYTVADMLHFGRAMNPSWDESGARRLAAAGVPPRRRAGKLSGGQRAQLALALALAKRPRLLILDEPLAALDPIARRDFLRSLLSTAGATGMTVVLSSHLVGELARACDHLIVIRDGRLRLAGELDELLEQHCWVSGSNEQTARLPGGVEVLSRSEHQRHSRLLVRSRQPLLNPQLSVAPVDIEELVLSYLEPAEPQRAAASAVVLEAQR